MNPILHIIMNCKALQQEIYHYLCPEPEDGKIYSVDMKEILSPMLKRKYRKGGM